MLTATVACQRRFLHEVTDDHRPCMSRLGGASPPVHNWRRTKQSSAHPAKFSRFRLLLSCSHLLQSSAKEMPPCDGEFRLRSETTNCPLP